VCCLGLVAVVAPSRIQFGARIAGAASIAVIVPFALVLLRGRVIQISVDPSRIKLRTLLGTRTIEWRDVRLLRFLPVQSGGGLVDIRLENRRGLKLSEAEFRCRPGEITEAFETISPPSIPTVVVDNGSFRRPSYAPSIEFRRVPARRWTAIGTELAAAGAMGLCSLSVPVLRGAPQIVMALTVVPLAIIFYWLVSTHIYCIRFGTHRVALVTHAGVRQIEYGSIKSIQKSGEDQFTVTGVSGWQLHLQESDFEGAPGNLRYAFECRVGT
jgi:hypothetical protein